MTKLKTHYGGWNPQRPDQRDRAFRSFSQQAVGTPSAILDLAGIPVLDQGQQGCCVGHGTAAAVMFDQKAQGEQIVVPSREFIYWNARSYEGTTSSDSGAAVRDGVKVVAKLGVPPDSDFPYNDQVFDLKPPAQAYADAVKQEALVYEALYYGHLHAAIASGFPFIYGFTVYESFESDEVAKTGIVPIPEKGEQVLGGHCVLATGFNASHTEMLNGMPPRTVKNRNSWGEGWGDHGDFYLPQWFYDNRQASDFWVLRRLGAQNT